MQNPGSFPAGELKGTSVSVSLNRRHCAILDTRKREFVMAESDEDHASLLQAIERIEVALKLVDVTSYPTSAFLIERALDQMRADAWPDAIDDAPASH
jgi:hypothetical protein